MGEKAFYLDPNENDWRGFLFDRDCMDDPTVLDQFQGVATQKMKDPETVEEAWNESRTVLTSNAKHFLRDSISFQRKANNVECHDCWGLLLIPNRGHDRTYALNKSQIAKGVILDGNHMHWKTVAWANLCVSLERNGKVKISRFERCIFCEQRHPLENERWYRTLPFAQGAIRPRSK